MSHICAKSGLALLSEPVTGYRIAKSSYGPVNPVFRLDDTGSRRDWSRFDTVGSTLYLAGDQRTAYAESLSWARMTPSHRKSLQKAADFAGISLEQISAEVRDDWERSGKMTPGWVPVDWREGRLLYKLHIEQPGEWIDLTAAESIAAINRDLGEKLNDLLEESLLTLSTLTGDKRGNNHSDRHLAARTGPRQRRLPARCQISFQARWRNLLGLLDAPFR